MRISKFRCAHLLGVDEFSFDCDRLNLIEGQNGTGKSSLLEGFKAAIGGGNLARLQRVGSDDPPEAVLELDGGALLVERKGKKTRLRQRIGDSKAYETVASPQAFLDGLVDPDLTNPVKFLQASPEDQAVMIVEALAPELDEAELLKVLDGVRTEIPTGRPLEALAALHKDIYVERTGVNVSATDKERSEQELLKGLPATLPEDPSAEVERLRRERDAAVDELSRAREAADTEEKAMTVEAQGEHDASVADVRARFKVDAAKRRQKLEADVAELQRVAEAEIEVLRGAAQAKADEHAGDLAKAQGLIQAAAVARRHQIAEELEPAAQGAIVALQHAESQRDRIAAVRAHQAMADRFGREARDLRKRHAALDKALKAIDDYRLRLARNLPIEGLVVDGRQILLGGVPFSQVNTAARIRVAVQVAALRAHDQVLQVIFIDGAEALDSKSRALLYQEIEAAGVQAFIARVTDEPLQVQVSA